MNVPLVNPLNDLAVQEADLLINRNLEGTISMLESRGYTSDNQMQILIQKQITKTILKMFLGAIQEDADDRGYEICQLLETPQQVCQILFQRGSIYMLTCISLIGSNGNQIGKSKKTAKISRKISRACTTKR